MKDKFSGVLSSAISSLLSEYKDDKNELDISVESAVYMWYDLAKLVLTKEDIKKVLTDVSVNFPSVSGHIEYQLSFI